ncbi:MAG: hypothetical protein JXA21_19290 [Anaerolineae bacterium]|nr:hypothetical protein [Anaerolineae bacterium]
MNKKHRIGLWLGAWLLAATALALAAPQAVWACGGGVICVDADASGAATGLSWTDAFTNVQAALDMTNANGGAAYEIWVAEGVYYPDEGGSHVNDAVTETFRIAWNNVQLYGGFTGGETTRDARDWRAHPTILSGDIDANDWNTDTNGIAETWNDLVGNNALHVLWLDGATNQSITGATVLDGFVITAGSANGGGLNDWGGGLYCAGNGSGHVCSPALTHVTFSGNYAKIQGGGMYNRGAISGTSSPALTYVIFSGNRSGGGGGMYNDGNAGGVSSPVLTYVTFSGNYVNSEGGGMHNSGYEGESNPTLTHVTFSDNWAMFGGGMFNNGLKGESNPALAHVIFSGNHVDLFGGGMFNQGNEGASSPTLINVIFSGNYAGSYGGGMVNQGPGGTSSPTLVNVTFSSNHAESYGGGMLSQGTEGGSSRPVLVNCILWGNVADNGPQFYNDDAAPTFMYSDVQWQGSVYPGIGNLNINPQFVAPVTAMAAPTTTGNYRLRLTSPVIDAGNNFSVTLSADLDGYLRRVDVPGVSDTGNGAPPIVDMGAYEARPASTLVYLPLVLR